ncbi:potassium channel, sub T, member 2, partial [Modicella reniformis]
DVRVVFLSRNKASEDVKTLLDMPMYKNRTTMLVGNGLDEADLKRCQALDAAGVFIIPDRVYSDLESQDTMTTLLAWSLHLYAPDTRVFTFNLLPETGTFQWGTVEQSMCISDVKQLLLAYNCRHRGTATLILNLLHPSEPANNYEEGWEAQYGDGTGNELYFISIPEVFIGWTFAQVSWFVFQEFQTILIGVDIFLKSESSSFDESGRDGPHTHDLNDLRQINSFGRVRREQGNGNSWSDPRGQYHLTLNPGNSYRLGNTSDLSKMKMDIYYEFREFRAEARTAAKRRAGNRKGRKAARQADGTQKPPQGEEHVYEVLLSEKGLSTHKGEEASPRSSNVGVSDVAGGGITNKKPRKIRPAWNVALYEDEDDDDDNGGDESSDGSSLERTKDAQRAQSFQLTPDHLMNNNRNSSKRTSDKFRQRSSEEPRSEFLLGALDREDSFQRSTQEMIPISEFSSDQEPEGVTGPSLTPPLSSLDSGGLYPSNFDLNAAAAAAMSVDADNDGFVIESLSQQGQPVATEKVPRASRQGSVLATAVLKELSSGVESIKPLIRKDLSSLRNHIVICADVGENLYRFISTLRLAQIVREDLKTIVVLSSNPQMTLASEGSFQKGLGGCEGNENLNGHRIQGQGGRGAISEAILSFPRVFWVVGNCRHQRDLVRAGILEASSIVVMSHHFNGLEREEFADSTAIMAHHMIYQTLQQRNLLGRQHIVVEILERGNIRFLNMRDLNAIQSYHGNRRLGLRIGANGFWMTPIFASGQVLITSLLDNVLFQAYSKTHILDLIKLCCGVRFKQAIELDQMLGIDCSSVCLLETPAQFVGKSFLNLFQGLALLHGIVPLGLYRAPDRELNNSLPFVFTNPLPGILLKPNDLIYVLKP